MDGDPPPFSSRLDLAEARTILANERTFAGWMRTSLAALALGAGFQALFASMEPAWLPRAIATGFLLLAAAIIILSERRAAVVMDRLGAHVVITAKPVNLGNFTAAVALGAAALIAAVWLFK